MAFQYQETSGGSSSSGGSQSQSGTLPWYNTMAQNLLGQGQGLAQAPWQVYGGPRTAGFVNDQLNAFQGARQQIGQWRPNMQQANQATGQALGSLQGLQQSPHTQGALGALNRMGQISQFNPNQQQQFMNPYISNVTNEIARLGNQNFQDVTLNALNSNFTDAGQFGSARQMAMTSDAAARAQREISGQQGQALMQAQNQAAQQYGDWANRGIGAQGQIAQGQMGINQFLQGLGTATGQLGNQYAQLGQMGQQMGQADVAQLRDVGNQQQALNQARLGATQQQFQEQQQAPWQPLNQWANLFRTVPTPQQSTASSYSGSSNTTSNWGTNFKKGGLVQMAEGGRFDFQISPEEQEYRDGLRLNILMQEANDYPDDENLMSELRRFGVDTSNLVPQKLASADIESDVRSDFLPPVLSSPISQTAPNFAREIFDERVALLDRARKSPEFAPIPERSFLDRAGESMFRAAAAGPANWGQMIGRAGTSYFDLMNKETDENKNRALQRLALEDKILPDVPKTLGGLGGRGTSEQFVYVRGTDGKSYMVNRLDPSQRMEVGSGANMSKIIDGADQYAKLAVKEGVYETVEEKEKAYEYYKNKYITDRMQKTTGAKASESGTVPDAKPSDAPPSTIIQRPGEVKAEEKIGVGTGEQYSSIQEGAVGAQATLNSLDAIEKTLEGYDTGKFTPALTAVAQWFDDLGIKVDKDLPAKEAFASGVKDLVLSFKNASGSNRMPGAMSDADRQFLERMAPSLSNTPEGNKLLIEMYRRLAKRQIEVAQMARRYKNREGGRGYDDRFIDEMTAYSEANPLFADLNTKGTSGSSKTITVDW